MGDGGKCGLHGRRVADELRKLGKGGGGCRGKGGGRGEDRVEGLLEFVEVEGFDEVGGCAAFAGFDGVVKVAVGGDDENGEIGMVEADGVEDFEAVVVRKADVEDHEGWGGLVEFLQAHRGGGAEDGMHLEALDELAEGGGEGGFVFDDENGMHEVRMGV